MMKKKKKKKKKRKKRKKKRRKEEEEDEEELRPKVQTGCRAHPFSYSPGVKRLRCESDYSPPYNTEVKNEGTAASTPFVSLMACAKTP